jgi:predicted DNA-binding WGR domain protein
LRTRGLVVDTGVGQSTFRLPLAVRRIEDTTHRLGVLVDDHDHYAQGDLLERYLLRPGVLQAFGWNTITVFTKDWFHDPEGVLRQIDNALAGEKPEEAPVADDEPIAAPESGGASLSESREAPLDDGSATSAEPHTEPAIAPVPKPRPATTSVSSASIAAPAEASSPRRFEFVEDGSSKFWEVSATDSDVTVRFGRIGTKGQAQTKSFASADAARREMEKLIRSKVAKGYAERSH